MDVIDNYPQGYWIANEQKYINKYQAMVAASRTHSRLKYVFFDNVWQNFDRSLLGKYSLNELYKQRAQQLRDKYDYLILYFSGGADSYNVLRSFIDNGIKLDEVCVKWCMDTITSHTEIYKPNQIEKSALNYLSEWDYAIKPVLDHLAQYHPEIKIEIVDWFKDQKLNSPEEAFNLVNHWHDVEINSLAVWSPSENKMLEKGLTVGSIYGVDKPATYFEDGKSYMYFVDTGPTMGTPNPNNIFGTEYFYWAKDFPILTFEMAHVIIKNFMQDKELYSIAVTKENKTDRNFLHQAWQIQQKKLRHLLYDNWTNRFQAFKPSEQYRSDKHWWIFKHPELVRYKEEYNHFLSLHKGMLAQHFYKSNDETTPIHTPYISYVSKKHFVI